MKRLIISLIILCSAFGLKADLNHYSFKGKLGSSITFKLDLQENNRGILSGETTYYRKNGKTAVIKVYGTREELGDGAYILNLIEYDKNKECGYFHIDMNGEWIKNGWWWLGEKTLDMNNLENLEPNYNKRFFHPVYEAKDAEGVYRFTRASGNPNFPEHGGNCAIMASGNKLIWSMTQVTPNIADATGTAEFEYSGFTDSYSNYLFETYIDENFIVVTRTNPEDGMVDDWGMGAEIGGIYVKDPNANISDYFSKESVNDDVDSEPQSKASASTHNFNDMIDWKESENFDEIDRMFECKRYVEDFAAALNARVSPETPEYQNLRELLNAEHVAFKGDELTELNRVRSIQMHGSDLTGYNFFKCRFFWEVRMMSFQKNAGSQRKGGVIYRIDDQNLAFDGYWYIGGDQPTYYSDPEHMITGILYKTPEGKFVMVFKSEDNNRFELYEFAK